MAAARRPPSAEQTPQRQSLWPVCLRFTRNGRANGPGVCNANEARTGVLPASYYRRVSCSARLIRPVLDHPPRRLPWCTGNRRDEWPKPGRPPPHAGSTPARASPNSDRRQTEPPYQPAPPCRMGDGGWDEKARARERAQRESVRQRAHEVYMCARKAVLPPGRSLNITPLAGLTQLHSRAT